MYNIITDARLRTTVAVEKQVLHILGVCVRVCVRARVCVVLVIHHANCMSRIILSSAGSTTFFHVISQKTQFSDKRY